MFCNGRFRANAKVTGNLGVRGFVSVLRRKRDVVGTSSDVEFAVAIISIRELKRIRISAVTIGQANLAKVIHVRVVSRFSVTWIV